MELYTWEYEGKQYAGKKSPVVEWNLRYLDDNGEYAWHNRNEVTNLRLARVVDKYAVVISKRDSDRLLTYARLLESSLIGMGSAPSLLIEEVYKQFNPTPPVTEPKGFGAIVEAHTDMIARQRFVLIEKIWYSENMVFAVKDFNKFINPTILSEGLK